MTFNNDSHQKTLNRIRQLVSSGKIMEAKDALLHLPSRPPELQNALGVCWMRLGEIEKAIDLYREMVLTRGGVSFRSDAPAMALVNYATALLLAGNVSGCEEVLNTHSSLNGDGVARLRQAIARWKRSLGFLRRLMVALYGSPQDLPVALDFLPGWI